MAFDVNAFVGDILQGVTVDDSVKTALGSLVTNPTVAKRLEEMTLRQSDYSRLSNEYAQKVKAAQDYWDSLKTWKEQEEARIQADRQIFERKLADGGIGLDDLAAAKKLENVAGKDELAKLAQDALAYNNTLVTVGLKHLKEFGEVLDVNELMTVIQREGVPLNIAYERLIQPKREEVQKAEVQKLIAQAREEGKAEALKNVTLPSSDLSFQDGIPSAVDRINKPDSIATNFGVMAAVKAFADNQKAGRTLG